ncbi:DNA-binding XRE family transcriptional regulator [Stackebrandtia albiflava]|uniref:DNA-binding XRE family transcriptional regulator n=1 Tax=Stackebrandtia albiflava TaxID=406432 RepID=A0A562UQ38_9ACTN|nr:DNA-binding XRE family transcriptional regulator [Stackebrandtia albiflava]
MTPEAGPAQWFGAELRHHRIQKRLSQEELGRRVYVSAATIGKIEKAERRCSRELAISLDGVLNTGGVLARACSLLDHQPDKPAHETDTKPRAAVDDTTVMIGSQTLPQSSAAVDEFSEFGRRMSCSVMPIAVLEQLELDVERLAESYMTTPRPVRQRRLQQARNFAFTEIERNRTPRQLRRLHRAAAQLCGLEAHSLMDGGYVAEAALVVATGWICGKECGDRDVAAWLKGVQSLIAYWAGDNRTAMSMAAYGASLTRDGSVAVRLPSLLARAAAACGDASTTYTALSQAEAARERIDGAQDGRRGMFDFPAAKEATYAGTSLLALGDGHTTKAVAFSQRAIELYTAPAVSITASMSVPDVLAARLDLATAHLRVGELDGAAEQIMHVMAADAENRTASIRKRAGRLTMTLLNSPYADATIAKRLSELLRQLTVTPAAQNGRTT